MLARDAGIDITDESDPQRDITLVHAGLLTNGRGRALRHAAEDRIVVAFATNDPVEQANLLASGIRGYHCAGEPWPKLFDVLRMVHNGEVRSDPPAMHALILMYRCLLRATSARTGRPHAWRQR